MERDLAIVYKSELYKVNKILNKLKEIGLDTTNYENAVYNIEDKCCTSNKEDLEKSFDTPFVVDYLEANYSKAINNLKIIEKELSKYEVYMKVSSFTSLLKNIIESNNITSKELEELSPQLISILNSLKKSNTLDYSAEGNIVDSIYEVTYYLLKEEIKLNKKSLFDSLIKDEVHTMYLDKEISKELNKLDKNDPKNNEIFNRKNTLDLNGINSHYLDYELLSLLVHPIKKKQETKDITKLKPLYDRINNELFIYGQDISKIHYNISDYEEEVINLKKPLRYIKNIGSIILSASIITTLIGGAYRLGKHAANETSSLKSTTITTYDTRDNSENTTEPFYGSSEEYTDGIIVTKYEPYRKKIGGFYRYVTTYNLGEANELSNEDILNLNFEGLGIDGKQEKETKDTLTYENVYNDIYYIITRTSVNENDVIISKGYLVLYILLSEILAAIVYFFLLGLKGEMFDEVSIGLISGIIDIKKDLEDIKHYTKDKEDYINKGKKLIKEVEELLNTYDDEIRQLIKYVDSTSEHGDDKVNENLRTTLEQIYKRLSAIEEYTDNTTIKDTTTKIRKRAREI